MREHLRTLPNQITAARLVLLPILWTLTLLKLPTLVGIGLLLSLSSDILDGHLARRLGQVSKFGSKFDSLVDNILLPSAAVWLWLLRPEMYREHALACLIAFSLYISSLLLGVIKFRRFANLHLQSARIGSVVLYLFAAHALIADQYSPLFFYLAAGMFVLSSTESLLLQLICSEVNEHMGSIFFVLRR